MRLRRVVVTGMGAISPFGHGVDALLEALQANKSGIIRLEELEGFSRVRSRLAALVPDVNEKEIPRKYRRSMSRMSIYATLAAREALNGAFSDPLPPTLGVVIGSTVGSPIASQAFFEQFVESRSIDQMKPTVFFQIMNHSCASNVAQTLNVTGRILAPSAACATGCQAVGYAYEMIAWGKQDQMLCGGADEFHPLMVATFDMMDSASFRYNDHPEETPRPFDIGRDGIVCGEGAGILLIESLESAKARGATILAEVIGFATTADPSNIANPDAASIRFCMEKAIADAGIDPGEVDYVNAHATGTDRGDVAESQAIFDVFGGQVPVSSLKGHLSHTMAASGSLEIIATVGMINRGVLIPTRNLHSVDPRCSNVRHLTASEERPVRLAVKNNFALGGVNASIVLRRYEDD
jgi:3-oxoacyl-[acyl-carrier-protein] synthase II